jgi:hypothetical protein
MEARNRRVCATEARPMLHARDRGDCERGAIGPVDAAQAGVFSLPIAWYAR